MDSVEEYLKSLQDNQLEEVVITPPEQIEETIIDEEEEQPMMVNRDNSFFENLMSKTTKVTTTIDETTKTKSTIVPANVINQVSLSTPVPQIVQVAKENENKPIIPVIDKSKTIETKFQNNANFYLLDKLEKLEKVESKNMQNMKKASLEIKDMPCFTLCDGKLVLILQETTKTNNIFNDEKTQKTFDMFNIFDDEDDEIKVNINTPIKDENDYPFSEVYTAQDEEFQFGADSIKK